MFGIKGDAMFDAGADLFFEDVRNYRSPPGDYGVLYLLRRDICHCLGRDPANGSKIDHFTLWPGGMAILAGIDLLAKFYKGDDASGQVGDRFKDFVHEYFQSLSPGDEAVIYKLRNSLLHSFGLYSKGYHFLLTAAGGVPLVQQPSPSVFQIDLMVLYERFEQAIERYRKDLEHEASLQAKFLKMFSYYGMLHMG
jgi:hypothetical protein